MKKTWIGIFTSVVMIFAFSFTARAQPEVMDITYSPFSISDSGKKASELIIGNDAEYEFKGIEEIIIEAEKAVLGTNQPPVAELQPVILNPDSLVNGQITTNTQIAWLWSYDGIDYTYDPDGDSISDMQIGGISNSDIIGMMQGDIGFATQFTVAGQYQLTFQVQDANGAWSNIAKYVVNVEPADGNTRPSCSIVYTPSYLIPNQRMMISWKNSTDSDGDSIVGIGGMVIKDGVTATALGDFIEQINQTDCVLSFKDAGSYEIWFRVCDSRNAWSNWSIFNIEVENVQLTVDVYGYQPDAIKDVWWVDNIAAKAGTNGVPNSWEGANYLFNTYGTDYFPSELPDKLVTDNFKVSGTLKTYSGKPVSNVTVTIDMPLTRRKGVKAYVLTDSSGNFSYIASSPNFWVTSGYIQSVAEFNYRDVGDTTGDETKYIRSAITGTNYVYPTKIHVSAGNADYDENISFLVGYTQLQTVGRLMYVNAKWYYF